MVAEDLILAERASRGDEEAYNHIYQTNYKQVYYHISQILGDRCEAEDLTQEVFLRAYQFMGTYSGNASLSRWLRKVATNLCIDRMRKKTLPTVQWPSIVSKDGEEQDAEFPDGGPTPLESIQASEGEETIHEAISDLPEYYRKVVVLYDVMDLPGDEVAARASCPVGTVKSRLSRAHVMLKRRLAQEDNVLAVAGA